MMTNYEWVRFSKLGWLMMMIMNDGSLFHDSYNGSYNDGLLWWLLLAINLTKVGWLMVSKLMVDDV